MAVAAFTKDSNKTMPKLDGFKPSSLGHDTLAMESAKRFGNLGRCERAQAFAVRSLLPLALGLE